MRILYIGHYSEGSTSRMRGEILKKILSPKEFLVINTDIPMNQTTRLFRSLGWRHKIGPFISRINAFVKKQVDSFSRFDLVWIDKGVFIRPELVQNLRKKSELLVHFTPDPAFLYHRSRLFYQAIPLYDFCITTKSFELEDYAAYGAPSTLFCTQGYDPALHKSYHPFEAKKGVVFIGHREDDREEIIARLIEKGVSIKLAGIRWNRLVRTYRNRPNLEFLGEGIFGEQYAQALSGSLMGLGFLSRIIPEKHTTRTFEIPACGTALATERNPETGAFFKDDEVLFYEHPQELIDKVIYALNHPDYLRKITEKGQNNVLSGPYSYPAILESLVTQMRLKPMKDD